MLPTLKQGDSGKDVFVARCLLDMDELSTAFDQALTDKVIAFQLEHTEKADGIIGKTTWTALAEAAPTVSTTKHKYSSYASAVQTLLQRFCQGRRNIWQQDESRCKSLSGRLWAYC